MSYWFGLTIERYTILVSDRRRIYYERESLTDDSSPKIFKINDSIHITGAGLLPFVEDVAKDFREMFGLKRLSLQTLRNSYSGLKDKLLKKYWCYHNQILKQLKEKGLDASEQEQQCTSVVIGAVSEEGTPFLLVSSSVQSFRIREQCGPEKFVCMPPLNPTLTNIINPIRNLIAIAGKALNKKGITISEIKNNATKLLPEVIHKAASEISSVSHNGDIAIIGHDNSWRISFD
jgi:hypothetical protein